MKTIACLLFVSLAAAQQYAVPVYSDAQCTQAVTNTIVNCGSFLNAATCTFCPNGQYMEATPSGSNQLALRYGCPTSSPTGRCTSTSCSADTVTLGACSPVFGGGYHVKATQTSASPGAAGNDSRVLAPPLTVLLALFFSRK